MGNNGRTGSNNRRPVRLPPGMMVVTLRREMVHTIDQEATAVQTRDMGAIMGQATTTIVTIMIDAIPAAINLTAGDRSIGCSGTWFFGGLDTVFSTVVTTCVLVTFVFRRD